MYVVQSGRATLVTTTGIADLGPGGVVGVRPGSGNRFTEVTEDLALLVVFAPPYESRAAGWGRLCGTSSMPSRASASARSLPSSPA